MNKPDGHRLVDTMDSSTVKFVDCTRWEEIRECVNYHIKAAHLLNAPTTFRVSHQTNVASSSKLISWFSFQA